MENNVIMLRFGEHWVDERGFLYNKFQNTDFGHELTPMHAQQHVDAMIRLCNGRKIPFLVDGRDVIGHIGFQAGRVFGKNAELQNLRTATAFLVNSVMVKLLVKLYLKTNRSDIPRKIFTDETKAIEWMLEYQYQPERIREAV